jgi:hypothetical protein
MPPEQLATVERNLISVAAAAERFALPGGGERAVSQGSGPDDRAGGRGLEAVRGVCFFEKVEFAACAAPAWSEAVGPTPRPTWLVAGMEAHICVFQTVRALRARGHEVIVLADAVASRSPDNRTAGLALCAATGATIAPTETVIYDLLGRAGTDDFKALSKLMR